MSAYNALKHFIRAEAEMFVSEFTDEPIGVVASGAVLSLTWKGRAVVTVSASLPAEGRVGTVTVYQSGAYPHEYLYLRVVRYPHDIRKVAEEALAEARAAYWRDETVKTDSPSPF
jgi:hypothetical protein